MKKLFLLTVLLACIGFATIAATVVGAWDDARGFPVWHYDAETVLTVAPVTWFDEFAYKTLDTNIYTVTADNSGSALAGAGINGWLTLTSGASNGNTVQVSTPLIYEADHAVCCEIRFIVTDGANTAFFCGLTDAVTESGTLPITGSTTTITTTATDAAGFWYDPSMTTKVVRAMSVNNGTDSAAIACAATVAVGDTHVYRVEIEASGYTSYFVDGVCIGGTAGPETGTPLCAYAGFANREGATNTAGIDYIRVWQKR